LHAVLLDRVLVDFPVLHDQCEILFRIGNKVDVLYRIAIDEKQIIMFALIASSVVSSGAVGSEMFVIGLRPRAFWQVVCVAGLITLEVRQPF
jgi:hypothetical protein